MVKWQDTVSGATARLPRPGLPRKVLRHLILQNRFPVGSRFLDIGCGQGDLVEFFESLGFPTVGIDAAFAGGTGIHRMTPHLDLYRGHVDGLYCHDRTRFDMVLVRDLEPYCANLLSLAAFSATARLLSLVRPGGLLVFLVRQNAAIGQVLPAHSAACYERHLGGFPGCCRTTGLPDAITHMQTWRSLLAHGRRSGFVSVSLRIDAEQRLRDDWLRHADSAAAAHRLPCCTASESSAAA